MKKAANHALSLTLLGEPGLIWQGQPLTAELISSKGQALLIYLALAGRAYSRSALAGLLWGDLPEERARGNLRTVLNKLRPYVGDYLTITRQTIAFNPAAPYSLDVSEFETLVSHPERGSIAQLEAAVALYRGHFLDDFQINHAPDFEMWLIQERERLRRAFSSALKQLISLHEQAGDLAAAIATGQQLLQHDPLDEATYRHLMQLYHLIGDQATALRLYQNCLETLREELGVEPSLLTNQVYHQILVVKSMAPLAHSAPVPPPLIGRTESWQQLQQAWHNAVTRRPGSVWLIGEAGIGKSRLAEEFCRWVSQQEATVVTAHCYAAEGNLPYGPVAQWLRSDPIFATLPHLEVGIRTEITRLLPEIWGEQAGPSPTNLLTEGWQRQAFFEALARAILACRRPLLLILDDLQWCDPDSLEWLHYLLRFDPNASLLLLATLRPEEITPDHPLQTLRWQLGYGEAIREIELARLNVQETARLAASLIHEPLPAESLNQLYEETEGNPLFVVELVRAGLAGSNLQSHRLPPRLQAVITARLNRLTSFGRELAGMAAVIGRNFDVEMLKQISRADEETLVRGLEELWQQQIIREQGTGLYDFSHDKIREVAYTHLSPAQRQLIHRRVAAGLVQRYGRGPHAASNRIAAHYEQAGEIEAAVLAYREAATAAWTLSAREVLAYLTTGLELLQRLPATPQRDQLELDLLLERGATLMQARGNADPGVAATFERARDLLLKMDDLLQIGPVLWGLWSFYNVRGQYDMAHQLAEQIRQTTQLVADPSLEVVMDATLGITYLYTGQLKLARHHINRALSNYQMAPERCAPPYYPLDLSILLLPYAGWAEWLLGYPDQALAHCVTAISRAHQQNQRLELAYATVLTAFVHYLRREPDQIRAHARPGRAMSEQYGYDILAASMVIFGHWVELMDQPKPGLLEQIEQGLAAWQINGAGMQVSSFLAMLAEAQGRCGQPAAGLITLERALAHLAMHGERFFEAELYRLQGELHRTLLDDTAAEASFQQALAVAQGQESRMLALRTATSLAQLWQQQGRAAAAYALLSEIFGQFKEGFTTSDLQRAQALLVQLTEEMNRGV